MVLGAKNHAGVQKSCFFVTFYTLKTRASGLKFKNNYDLLQSVKGDRPIELLCSGWGVGTFGIVSVSSVRSGKRFITGWKWRVSSPNVGQSATQDTSRNSTCIWRCCRLSDEGSGENGESVLCSLSFQMSSVLQTHGLFESQHPVRPCFRKHPSPGSERRRAFSHITQMVPDNRPREKSNITNNTVSGREKRGFGSKSSRRCCLLIQNSVSVSQSMLSKIPTLSWVQSHVGAIMGRKVQQRWIQGMLHQLFTGGAGDRRRGKWEKAVFLHIRTSTHPWQHPKQTHSTF